jgi:hypothetical protein
VVYGTAYATAVLLLPFTLGQSPFTHGLLARLASGSDCSSRLTLWSNVLRLIGEKPWSGWGWGELDYAHYITLYPARRFCDILDNAHNLPLQLAVELGIPVALLACAAIVAVFFRQKPWRETDSTRQLAWAVLTLLMLHSMLEYPLWYGPFQIAFGLAVAMLWQGPATQATARRRGNTLSNGRVPGVASLLLIMGCGYAAWDYHRVSQIYLPPEARDAEYRVDPLAHARGSVLFRNQVRFAELTTTPLTRDNAQWTFDTALALLHFSPEPRVIEKVIESATMLGRVQEAQAHLARFRAAFPQDYARWKVDKLAAPAPGPATP